MLTLPQEMKKVILLFVPLCSERVWDYAQILLMGAILSPGKRTVSAALTVALLDRLTHKAHIVEFVGESYRFRQRRQQDVEQS
jgi:DNA replication protein DnaC